MAPCAAGEDEIALAPGYAANLEVARADPRVRESGGSYTIDGRELAVEPAIEVGNIFMLGTRYSEPLGARYLDEHGDEQLVWMGSYGLGPARVVAAAVEQFSDEHGISWPKALAPFGVHLVVIGDAGSPERAAADRLYDELLAAGIEVLYDDREANPGEKFADAELLGCPLRLTVGRRALEAGEAEVQVRRGREQAPGLALETGVEGIARAVDGLWQGLP
jgi:prolyl-tRNA synthetase